MADTKLIPVEDIEEPSALAIRQPMPAFSDNMDDDDLLPVMPFLKLGQPLSTEVTDGDRKPGDFYVPDYPSLVTMTAVPLGVQTRRIMWAAEGSGIVACRSNDGIMGEGDPGGDCRACQFSQFKKGERSACQESRLFATYVKEWDLVVLWELRGSAMRLARQIKTWINQKGPLGTWAMEVRSQKMSNNKGAYWVPQARFLEMDFDVPSLA